MKRVISVFLAFVMAIQILPVKEVGSLLCSNQIQEELPHSVDSGKMKESPSKTDLFYDDLLAGNSAFDPQLQNFFLYKEALPAHFVGEIQTPPPNQG